MYSGSDTLYSTMLMSSSALCWAGLGLVLFTASFGVTGFVALFLYLISFIIGFLVMLYFTSKHMLEEWKKSNQQLTFPLPCVGLPKLVEGVQISHSPLKSDKRMTGSTVIDDVLQEVSDYIYRDYVHSWYKRISDDEKRFQYDIRKTVQRVRAPGLNRWTL